jgi:hypothetical protein
MGTRDDAMRILTRYFVGRERLQKVEEYEGFVRAGVWKVTPFEREPWRERDGFTLYRVDLGHPVSHPDAVAVFPDGRMFHLNDAGEFRGFFAASRGLVTPLELADLLKSFQSDREGAGEHIVQNLETLSKHLTPEQIASLPIGLPEVATRGNGTLSIVFFTWFIGFPSRGRHHMNFNRWRVEVSADGRLDWQVDAVAREMKSLFYSRGR